MTSTPPSDLLYPTCAQCKGIGLPAVPDWQFDMEDELGFDVLKALLLAHGGREVYLSKLQIDDPNQCERARAWMFSRFGHGKILIPLGPLSHSNRVAWTIYAMLRDGASLAAAARAAGVHSRAVSRHKKRLQDFGALPVPQSIITGEPHK